MFSRACARPIHCAGKEDPRRTQRQVQCNQITRLLVSMKTITCSYAITVPGAVHAMPSRANAPAVGFRAWFLPVLVCCAGC
jgi:hypothetical protein